MAIATVNVIGDVLLPSGSAAGGEIRVRISEVGSVDDGGDERVVVGESRFPIAADGSVDFELIPNDIISPSGTFYVATIAGPTGVARVLGWNLASAPDPVDIGSIPQVAL